LTVGWLYTRKKLNCGKYMVERGDCNGDECKGRGIITENSENSDLYGSNSDSIQKVAIVFWFDSGCPESQMAGMAEIA
jgi:hypothetical protein